MIAVRMNPGSLIVLIKQEVHAGDSRCCSEIKIAVSVPCRPFAVQIQPDSGEIFAGFRLKRREYSEINSVDVQYRRGLIMQGEYFGNYMIALIWKQQPRRQLEVSFFRFSR